MLSEMVAKTYLFHPKTGEEAKYLNVHLGLKRKDTYEKAFYAFGWYSFIDSFFMW